MYHDVGANCWLAPPPSDLPQCQDAESFANSPECGDRQDVTNFLIVMQVLPIWGCIIVDSCIMYTIYKYTKQLEKETENKTQTNSFFGQAEHQGEEVLVEIRGLERGSTISAIHADLSGEQGQDENRLPTARSFFGYQSSVCNTDDNEKEESLSPPVQDKPMKKYSTWRPILNETVAQGNSAKIFDDFGRIVHSELEPETSTASPNETVPESTKSTEMVPPDELSRPQRVSSGLFKSTRSAMSGTASTGTRKSRKRSRIVAVQGLWYITGFFFSYIVGTVAVVIYQTSGTWIIPLFQAGYFFLALQGAWNFVVFSKGRREMKTWIGGKVKTLIWGSCCCFRLPTLMFSATSSPAVSGAATPPQFATSVSSDPQKRVNISCLSSADNNQEREIEISGFNKIQPDSRQRVLSNMSTEGYANRRGVSFVSDASTVVHSNRNNIVSRVSALVSVVEDVGGIREEGDSDEERHRQGGEDDEACISKLPNSGASSDETRDACAPLEERSSDTSC